jgi:glycosyltransferase involved in cell wall biosynthesis
MESRELEVSEGRGTRMNGQIVVWAAAPNRHLEPMLDAFARAGALEHVYYATEHLRWNQLGTPPVARGSATATMLATSEQHMRRLRSIVRSHPYAIHLVISVGHSMCWKVLHACQREGATTFLWGESLQPRPAWHPRRIVRTALYRSLLRGVAGVLALTHRAATDFLDLGVPRSRIHPTMFAGPDDQRPYRRPERERIVFCGRLIPLKGIDLLCQAARAVGSRRPGVALDIVGEGPEAMQLRLLDGAPLEVVAHGAVPSARAREIVARASVLVLPTRRREGWGYVVNEAVAAAVPAVVSSVVGAAELIVPEVTGFVFPEGDTAALARSIEAALDLHRDDTDLASAFATMQFGIRSEVVAGYLLGVLSGDEIARAPWQEGAEALGGNEASARWAAWGRGGKVPVAREVRAAGGRAR